MRGKFGAKSKKASVDRLKVLFLLFFDWISLFVLFVLLIFTFFKTIFSKTIRIRAGGEEDGGGLDWKHASEFAIGWKASIAVEVAATVFVVAYAANRHASHSVIPRQSRRYLVDAQRMSNMGFAYT
jgi:hypothetical protein